MCVTNVDYDTFCELFREVFHGFPLSASFLRFPLFKKCERKKNRDSLWTGRYILIFTNLSFAITWKYSLIERHFFSLYSALSDIERKVRLSCFYCHDKQGGQVKNINFPELSSFLISSVKLFRWLPIWVIEGNL